MTNLTVEIMDGGILIDKIQQELPNGTQEETDIGIFMVYIPIVKLKLITPIPMSPLGS